MRKQEDDPALAGRRVSSPFVAFLGGVGAGMLVILISSMPALFLENASKEGGQLQDLMYWILPSLGAATAGGVAALTRDASSGRITAIALLAFLSAVCITGVLDYVLLLNLLVGPTQEEAGWTRMLWGRTALVSSLALIVGALLGVMFGSPRRPLPLKETRTGS